MFNGQGELTHPDGEKYIGEFEDNENNGHGELTHPDGTTYIGQF